ncbi:MAG: protein kinase [Myxococcales bacterium]|nr:protein kinase [Myxococcales bacterium]
MGSQRGDDPKIETAPTVAGAVDAVAATHISTETGSPSRPGTDATVASVDRGLAAVTPARLVQVQSDLYERLGELARGGLGKISRARDLRSGRIVAIKEVIGGGDDIAVRFAREALITANLQHPAIVPVYEVGRWPNGEPFYAMKLVAGRPLNQVIDDAADLDARLRLVSHVLTVADALAYAHGERVIHRDLKPHNVLCGAHGETVVIDWGLARRLDDVETSSQSLHRRISAEPGQTFLGAIMGTPSYMPPEQARGARVDERADVYAIGAILYHLLAGAPAYTGRTLDELLDKVKAGPPQPIAERAPGVPADLAAIVERAMAREPDQRYPSAVELAHDLRRFTTGQLVLAHRYTTWQRVTRFLARHRAASASIAALLIVAVVAFVSVVRARDDARREAAHAEQQRARADAERDEARKRLIDAHYDRARVELSAEHPHTALAYVVAAAELAGLDAMLSFLAARALENLPAAKMLPGVLAGFVGVPGSRDFVVSMEGAIVRWNPDTDRRLWEAPGPGGDVEMLDAARVFTVSHPGVLILDAGTGKTRKLLAGPNLLEGRFSFDRAKHWVAAVTAAGLELFDLETETHVATVPVGKVSIAPAVSPDGLRLVVGLPSPSEKDRSAFVDRAVLVDRSGKELAVLSRNCRVLAPLGDGFVLGEYRPGMPPRVAMHDWTGALRGEIIPATLAEVGHVASSPDGKLVAILLADGMVELHEIGQGLRWRNTISARGYEGMFDSRGRLWVFGAYAGVHVYDVASGIELDHWTGEGIGMRLGGNEDSVAIGIPTGVRAWNLGTPTVVPIAPTRARVRHVVFADGGRVVASSDDGVVSVYEPDGRVRELGRHGQRVPSLQVTRDNRVVTSSRDGTTVVRDLVSGAEVERYPIGPFAELAPDGVHLAFADSEGNVTLLDRTTKQRRVLATMEPASSLRWSPDGSKFGVVDQTGTLILWSADGTKLKEWPGAGVGLDLVFSHDGTWVVRTGQKRLELLSTVSGVPDRMISDESEYRTSFQVAFSPGDKHVAVVGQGRLEVIEIATSQRVLAPPASTDVIAVTFSPDGRQLYVGGIDRKIHVWDLARGQHQTEVTALGEVYGLRFDPAGTRLVVTTLGPAHLWNLAPLAADLPRLRAIVRCAGTHDPLTGKTYERDIPGCNALVR